MNWISKILTVTEKIKRNIDKRFPSRKDIETSKWASLDCCMKGPILKSELEEHLYVCPHCGVHKRVSGRQRLDFFFGKDNYEILDYPMGIDDPLQFPNYKDKLKEARKKTGQKSAFIICTGKVNGINVTAITSTFSYIGGSMGSQESEAFLHAIDHAIKNYNPVINFCSGGGIRLYESMIGLSCMARTTLAINELKKNNLLYLNVLTDPIAGGELASYGMLGDLHIAEPGAIVAFAGARVIKSTVKEELPEGFQQSEYVLKTGFVDLIVERKDLSKTIGTLLSILLKKNSDVNSELSNETSTNTEQPTKAAS
tara:strand:- start:794 stop:1729 length:936 start_codon:yes stop_codon:yes gene_type:complete